MIDILTYFLWFMIYSFIGWFYESLLCSFEERKLVNRGFLNGPFCPVYGFGAITVILALNGMTENVFILFFSGMLLTCTVEYIAAFLLEKLFDAKWWDYSKKYRFHINGRVCLLGAFVFGIFSVILIRKLHPFISSLTDRMPDRAVIVSCFVLFVVLLWDILITVNHILRLNGRLREIQQAINSFMSLQRNHAGELKAVFQESFENSNFFTERIRVLLHKKALQDIRLMHAFPRMKSLKYNDALQKIKDRYFNPKT